MNAFLNKRGLIVVTAVGLVWLVAGSGDWFMRFYWFHWRQTLISRPATTLSGAPFAPMQRTEVPPVRGGDLSSLISIDRAGEPFKDERPAMLELTDEFGYRNAPPTVTNVYPVVVTGSSFMNSGYPMTNMFSTRLSEVTGVPVYNCAFPGRGPFHGLVRFLQDDRFVKNPPRVLVWGVVEREIGAGAFGGLLYQIHMLQPAAAEGRQEQVFLWQSLKPSELKTALPNTSAIAQVARRIWARVRYFALGQMSPDIAVSTPDWRGRPFLFYTPAVHALKWTPEQRLVPYVAEDIRTVSDLMHLRGIRLVILLIPDKEQVYKEFLPAYLNNPSDPIPPSCLDALEQNLRGQGIPVVNMLETYRKGAAEGNLLYWRDDTHWNAEAIRLAAKAVQPVLEPLLTGPH